MDFGVDRAHRVLVFGVQSHSRQRHPATAEEADRENDFGVGRRADTVGCGEIGMERVLANEPFQ